MGILLPGDTVRSHRLRAQSPSCPSSDTMASPGCYLCSGQLAVVRGSRVSPLPPPRISLPEQRRELRKTVYFLDCWVPVDCSPGPVSLGREAQGGAPGRGWGCGGLCTTLPAPPGVHCPSEPCPWGLSWKLHYMAQLIKSWPLYLIQLLIPSWKSWVAWKVPPLGSHSWFPGSQPHPAGLLKSPININSFVVKGNSL